MEFYLEAVIQVQAPVDEHRGIEPVFSVFLDESLKLSAADFLSDVARKLIDDDDLLPGSFLHGHAAGAH